MLEQDRNETQSVSASRREALRKFGTYAGAATPAMLMLLDSNRQAAFATEGSVGPGGGHDDDDGRKRRRRRRWWRRHGSDD
ncbi:MAG: hypothetical protein ACR2QF_09265 [Geminicoccaceae bacterium]